MGNENKPSINLTTVQMEKEPSLFVLGKKYFIRTVTMALTGELVEQTSAFLKLKDAAWVADTGRFNEAVRNPSKINEIEPFARDILVNTASIVDATEIDYVLREPK